MKIQNIFHLVFTMIIAGISFIPSGFARAIHTTRPPHQTHIIARHPVAAVHHTTQHRVVTTHQEHKVAPHTTRIRTAGVKPKNIVRTPGKTAAINHSSGKIKVITHQKSGATLTASKPLKPTPLAAKRSIHSIFADHPKEKSLSSSQVIDMTKNRKITGQKAAMIAALAVQINDAKHPERLRFSEAGLLKKFSDKNSNLYTAYKTTLNKIHQTNSLPPSQQLFGPKKLSANTKIIQGNANDCYLLSSINSKLNTRNGPKQLEKMITRIKGEPNKFKVKFPGDKHSETISLTQSEIGMYSHVEKGGKWLAILSLAEAKRRDRSDVDPEITIKPGYQTQTMHLLNGTNYTTRHLAKTPTAQQTTNLQKTIMHALHTETPIGISTPDHALSIIGYKAGATPSSGVVTIKNPWGTSGWYNPKRGASSSSSSEPKSPGPWYHMTNGVFTVPMNQINNGFVFITYHPVTTKSKTTTTS
ncbi:MAG: hypothetical protein ABI597_07710 [Gammaproteobacteria bacterium]